MFPALQDLQGEVESYLLSVEAAPFLQNLILPPRTVSTVISDLWPSTTYLVSLQVSNGAHNTTKASVNVTTEDGGTACVRLCGLGVVITGLCKYIKSIATTGVTVYVRRCNLAPHVLNYEINTVCA